MIKNGINPAEVSDSKLVTVAQQSLAGQQKSIEAFQRSQNQERHEGDSTEIKPVDESGEVPTFRAGIASHQPTAEETAYKTIRGKNKEPISIELGRSETAAAKAAMG